jgi:tetratricopeptide (TPR) repeat protein
VRAEAYLNQFEKNGGQPILLDSAYDWLNKPLKCTTGKQAALWVRYFFLKKEWKELANWFEKAKKQGRFQWINGNIWSNELAWTAYRIGEAYWELGKPSEALPHLLNAKKWAPLIPDFGNKVGVCQLALSRLPDALATWMEVLKEDPEHVPSLSNVGFALMESGRLSEALEYLKKSLSLDPDHILSLSNAARCTLMKGDIRAARAYLKRIVVLQPDHAQAKTALIELEGKTKIY